MYLSLFTPDLSGSAMLLDGFPPWEHTSNLEPKSVGA
jgi:hypothetical protein